MKPIRQLKCSAALVTACLLVLTLASCANFAKNRRGNGGSDGGSWSEQSDATPLPERNENVSFAGPGSDSVNRELFPPVYFGFDNPKISQTEVPKIDAVARFLKSEPGGTLIIAGFTPTASAPPNTITNSENSAP